MKSSRISISISVFIAISLLLGLVQWRVDNPLLLLERFIKGGGWLEIPIISFYGAYVAYQMLDQSRQSMWRIRTWTIFSIVFFTQLILGLFGFEKFLMTGKLHFPIPMMILGGPVYRLQISFMPILFISTIILSGPAWCSQLCYFGAIDANIARLRKSNIKSGPKWMATIKYSIVPVVILAAILLRFLNVPLVYASIFAGIFGIGGLAVILVFSTREGKMIHCNVYCPIGTLVNHFKIINPFRFNIGDSCTSCMKCVPECKYGALGKEEIAARKPGKTCTLCGDCISACKPQSLYYKFPGLGPTASRNIYIGLTITLHAVFLALARM